MEPNADNLHGLRITSLDDEDDEETELPNQPLPTSTVTVAAVTSGYDDDDEDEDEEAEVMLGFLEKPKHPGLLLRHLFPSKAGGIPAWLDPVNLPSGNSSCCGFCGEPLHFVLQIYAPLENNAAAFHRTLFVFMCPSMACLHRDQHEQWTRNQGNPCRSVRVFRCQLPRTNAFYSSEPPSHNNSDKPLCAGAALCHWCGTWKGDKICGSCKKSRYCSEKHQALHWRSGHKNDCLQIINSSEASSSVLPAVGKVPARTSWPEFQIEIDDEVDLDSDSCDENSSKSLVIQKHAKPDDTMQSWMDQFEADADNRYWAYFEERVSRAPKQVLRYCRDPNAKPLWALSAGRPSNADIPKCSYCKGPLCYEFQDHVIKMLATRKNLHGFSYIPHRSQGHSDVFLFHRVASAAAGKWNLKVMVYLAFQPEDRRSKPDRFIYFRCQLQRRAMVPISSLHWAWSTIQPLGPPREHLMWNSCGRQHCRFSEHLYFVI